MYQSNTPNSNWLVKDHNPQLRKISSLVNLPLSQDDELVIQKLIDFVITSQDKKLNANLHLQPAVGLAAPQIGVNKQMYYIRIQTLNPHNEKTNIITEHALINPKIIGYSKQIICLKDGEGCLSVSKNHAGYVPRYYKVVVTGYDYLKKKEVKLTVKGYEAIVFQHEQKHLEGILYYDLINKRNPWNKDDNWIYL